MENNLDHEEKIHYLSLIIKSICEENNISKRVVVDDFIDLIYEEKDPTKIIRTE